MLPTLVVGRRVHRPNPDPIRRPVTGGAGRGGRRASGPAGGPAPGDGARRDRIGDGGGVRRVRGAAGPDEDGAGPCGNGADDDLVIRTGSGVSPGETEPFSPGTAIPGPGSVGRRSAEYQRFSSGAPARSGPLWQIWTNDAATGPGRVAADRTATAAGASIGRAGPRGYPPWSSWTAATASWALLDAERCTSHSKVQFQPSFSSAKCTSRVQNALLGEETGRSWSSQTAAPIPPRSISSDPTRKGH